MFNNYNEYLHCLKAERDVAKSSFDEKLIATKYEILGLRLPNLRKFAKEIVKQNKSDIILSHKNFLYYEEVLMYSFVLAYLKMDESERIKKIEEFLPFIDNWSNCDSFCSSLKVVGKNQEFYLEFIKQIIKSTETYFVRVGIILLMNYFLDEQNLKSSLNLVIGVKSSTYYVEMAKAWFFATSLAKNFNDTILFLKQNKKFLSISERKKIVSKSRDSFRILECDKKRIREELL